MAKIIEELKWMSVGDRSTSWENVDPDGIAVQGVGPSCSQREGITRAGHQRLSRDRMEQPSFGWRNGNSSRSLRRESSTVVWFTSSLPSSIIVNCYGGRGCAVRSGLGRVTALMI